MNDIRDFETEIERCPCHSPYVIESRETYGGYAYKTSIKCRGCKREYFGVHSPWKNSMQFVVDDWTDSIKNGELYDKN